MIFTGNEADLESRLAQGFENILFGLDVLSLIQHYAGITNVFNQCFRKTAAGKEAD